MRYIYILFILFLTGCSSTYQLSSYYSDDPIYGVTQSGDSIRVDIIENDFEFNRKLRFDSKFRWNFAQFAQNQPLSWYYRNFNQLGGWRSPYTPFDFYWNRYDFWWNWSVNMPFQFNSWNSPWYWNRWNNWYGWPHDYYWNSPFANRGGYGYVWNDWRWRNRIDNNYWEERNRRNVAYVNGRRGSTNSVVVTPNNNSVVVPRLRNNTNVRINEGRRIPTPDDVDVVIERPERGIIGRFVDKMQNKGIRVRTYQNPNNVPNTRIRDYNRIENNNNIIRNNNNNIRNYNRTPAPTRTAPTRTYSPPPSRSNNTGRSGGGVSISRGSRGSGKINQ